MSNPDHRVIVFGADGLRPDLITPELMPTYHRLIEEGTRYSEFYAAYPPHTRVNMSTFTTGCLPGRHGVVANLMLVPGAGEDGWVDTANERHIRQFQAQTGTPLLLAPTLGDRLHAHGSRLAVAASSSAGAALLWNPNHPTRVLNPSNSYGDPDLALLLEKLGPVPEEQGRTRFERARWATRALTDVLLGDPENKVMVLWLSEPDSAQHFYGLGAPESRAAMSVVDACLTEVLQALETQGLSGNTDLLLVSDHGHSTVKAHRSLREHLSQAAGELGFHGKFEAGGDYIYGRPDSPPTREDAARLTAWIQKQLWCDLVLTGVPDLYDLLGTLPLEQVMGPFHHGRAPLLAVTPKWSGTSNEFGVPGQVSGLTSLTALKSSHGAASPYDLRAFCLGYGPSFKSEATSEIPCGTVDIAPTICELLGLKDEHGFDGRVLTEGLTSTDVDKFSEQVSTETKKPLGDDSAAGLRLASVGQHRYLLGTTRETK